MYKNGKWLATGGATFVPMCPALKSLSDDSHAPRSYSTILPQYRLNPGEVPRPLQNEYPVWYFLTGELARPGHLGHLLKLDDMPDLRPATIQGLKQLTGVNGPLLAVPTEQHTRADQYIRDGWAYCVKTEAEETAMRYFKTSMFTIIRCRITLSKGDFVTPSSEVEGLAFIYTPGETWVDKEMSETLIESLKIARADKHKGSPSQCLTDDSVEAKDSEDAEPSDHAESCTAQTRTPPKAEERIGFTVAPLRDGNPPPRNGFRRPSSQPNLPARRAERARVDGEDDGAEDEDDEELANHYQELQKKINAQKALHDQEDRDAQAQLTRRSLFHGSRVAQRHRFHSGQLLPSDDESLLDHADEQAVRSCTGQGNGRAVSRPALVLQKSGLVLAFLVRFFFGFFGIAADTTGGAGAESPGTASGPAIEHPRWTTSVRHEWMSMQRVPLQRRASCNDVYAGTERERTGLQRSRRRESM